MMNVKRSVKNLPKRQRVAFGLVLAVFVGVIAVAVGTLVSRIGKVAVEVRVAPFDAAVFLNGAEVANGGTNYVLPGTYEMRVEREHFETLEETVEVGENQRYVVGKLVASDEEGERIMEERQKDYLAVEAVIGKRAVEEGEALKEKWPILQYLPVNNQFYSISYKYDDTGKPVVRVWAVDDYMMDIAKRKMDGWGVSLEGFELEYVVGD